MCKISLWLNQQIELDCSIIWKYSTPTLGGTLPRWRSVINAWTDTPIVGVLTCVSRGCSCVNSQSHSVRSECLKSRTTVSLDGIRYFAYEYNINEHAESCRRAPIAWADYLNASSVLVTYLHVFVYRRPPDGVKVGWRSATICGSNNYWQATYDHEYICMAAWISMSLWTEEDIPKMFKCLSESKYIWESKLPHIGII